MVAQQEIDAAEFIAANAREGVRPPNDPLQSASRIVIANFQRSVATLQGLLPRRLTKMFKDPASISGRPLSTASAAGRILALANIAADLHTLIASTAENSTASWGGDLRLTLAAVYGAKSYGDAVKTISKSQPALTISQIQGASAPQPGELSN